MAPRKLTLELAESQYSDTVEEKMGCEMCAIRTSAALGFHFHP